MGGMKLIIENWRRCERQLVWEQEFEQIFEELTLLEEGVLGNMWGAVKGTIDRFSEWGKEQFEKFVKFALEKVNAFISKLKQAGKIGKNLQRRVYRVLNILKLPKYLKVAAGILAGLLKLLTPAKVVDLFESFELLLSSNPLDALKKILGFSDIEEYTELAGGIKDFASDVRNPLVGTKE